MKRSMMDQIKKSKMNRGNINPRAEYVCALAFYIVLLKLSLSK